jgi:hypothetical protein
VSYYNDHSHSGEYAETSHHHGYYDLDSVAEEHHRHYDTESLIDGLREDLNSLRYRVADLEEQIHDMQQLAES